MRAAKALTTALAITFAMPAQAETLAIDGVYAANTDGAAGVRAITFERFGGLEGERLERAIATALDNAHLHGEPVFAITPADFAPASDDIGGATMRGYAGSHAIDVEDGVVERSRCIRKEKNDKGEKICAEEVIDIYECRRLHVSFQPDVALMAGDGYLYQQSDTISTSRRYCADQSGVPSVDALLDSMISRFAHRVRLDLAPVQRFNRIRIFESRKGLKGKDRKAFKRAIRLTKSDPIGACLQFEDVAARNPFQRSVLYNLALCHEAEGRLGEAADVYHQLVRTHDKGQFRSGMARVNSRLLAEEQLAASEPADHQVSVRFTEGDPALDGRKTAVEGGEVGQ